MPMVSFGECIAILRPRSVFWVHITPAGRLAKTVQQALEFDVDAMVDLNPETAAIAWADEKGDPVLFTATCSPEDEQGGYLQLAAWFVDPSSSAPAQCIMGTRLRRDFRSYDRPKVIGVKPGVIAVLFLNRVRLYSVAKREWREFKYPHEEEPPRSERESGIIETDNDDGIALVLPPIAGQGPAGSPVHALLTVGPSGQGIVWNVDTCRAMGCFMNYKSGRVLSMAHDGGCLWMSSRRGLLKLRCVVPATYWAVITKSESFDVLLSDPPTKHAGPVRLLHEALLAEAAGRPPQRGRPVVKGTVAERMETVNILGEGVRGVRLASTPLHPDVLVVGGQQAPRRARWQPLPPYLRMGPRMTEHARVLTMRAEAGHDDPQLLALLQSFFGNRPIVHGMLGDVADLCMQQNGVGLLVPTLGKGWLAVCRWRSPGREEQRYSAEEVCTSRILAVGRGPSNPHPAAELYEAWERQYNAQFQAVATFKPRAPPGTLPLLAQMRARWRSTSVQARPFGPVGVHWTSSDTELKRLCAALVADRALEDAAESPTESELEEYVPAWAQHEAPSGRCINCVDHGLAHAYVCVTCIAEQQVRAELRAQRAERPAANETAPAAAAAAAAAAATAPTPGKRKRIVPTRVTQHLSAAAAAAASNPGTQAVAQVAPELNDFVQRAVKHKVLPVYLCSTCATRCHSGHDVRNIGLRQDFTCECSSRYSGDVFRGHKLEGRPATLEEHLEATRCSVPHAATHAPGWGYPMNPPSQNGVLRYCRCGQDERFDPNMLQCIGCDDWWHSQCVAPDAPGDVMLYPEGRYICPKCYERRPAAAEVDLVEKPLGTSGQVVQRLAEDGKVVRVPCAYGGIWFAESERALKSAFVAPQQWTGESQVLTWFLPDPSVTATQVGQIYARVLASGLP